MISEECGIYTYFLIKEIITTRNGIDQNHWVSFPRSKSLNNLLVRYLYDINNLYHKITYFHLHGTTQ